MPTDDEAIAPKVQPPLIERVMERHPSLAHGRRCYRLGTPGQMRDRIAELEYLMLSPVGYELEQLKGSPPAFGKFSRRKATNQNA